MKKKTIVSILFCSLVITSCNKEDFYAPPSDKPIVGDNKNQTEIMFFSNRSALDNAIESASTTDSNGKSLSMTINSEKLRKEGGADSKEIPLSVLVPEKNFAKLLNADGEIIVGDTVYSITQHGTFFAPKSKILELRNTVQKADFSKEEKVGDDLYRIGDVYRFDTFKNAHFNQPDDDSIYHDQEEIDPEDEKGGNILRSENSIPAPNIEKFPLERASRKTWAGKIFQKTLTLRKSLTETLPGNRNRRLNCALFDYNYRIRQSIGITAKVQKKMWHGGWAKVKYWDENTIRIGFKNVILHFPYPDGVSYDLLFKRLRPVPPLGNNPNPYMPAPPSWKDPMFPDFESIEIPPFINISSPTWGDLIKASANHVSGILKKLAHHGEIPYPDGGRDIFENIYPYGKRPSSMDEIIGKIGLRVPIFAKDGIYVLLPAGELRNEEDQTEITFRFFDKWMESFILSYSNTFRDFPKFRLGGLDASVSNKDVSLVDGEFYACAYMDGWVGYKMYW